MGRILRIGNDSVVNYNLKATSDYDSDDPAATTSAWPDEAAMDQLFSEASPTVLSNIEGALVTFERMPHAFLGAMAKVIVHYDFEDGENPWMEMWVHFERTDEWVRYGRVQCANVFTGASDGARKIYSFTFGSALSGVDKVWLTMDPGGVGTPKVDWFSIQLFGLCNTYHAPKPNDGVDPCSLPPDDELYPGDDICKGDGGGGGGDDCPPSLRQPDGSCGPDWCNEASIQDYRNFLESVVPEFLPIFDAWLEINRAALQEFCKGFGPFPPDPPLPPINPPADLPPLDLCDEDSVAMFRAAIGGDSERLQMFDDYMDTLEEVGFFEIACSDPDPEEVPVDPETGEPTEEPPPPVNLPGPFGGDPGGTPEYPPKEKKKKKDDPDKDKGISLRYILTWSGNDLADAATMAANIVPEPPRYTFYRQGAWGPAEGVNTIGHLYTPATYALKINFTQLIRYTNVGLKMWMFYLRDSNNLRYSISKEGVYVIPAQYGCPPQPDWIITRDSNIQPAPYEVIKKKYLEYQLSEGPLVQNCAITLALPREDENQNDGTACSPGYKPRSILGFQRGGCLHGFTVKLKARWLRDVSCADYDVAGYGDYLHARPICLVLDINLKNIAGFSTRTIGVDLEFLKDAQPVESCT